MLVWRIKFDGHHHEPVVFETEQEALEVAEALRPYRNYRAFRVYTVVRTQGR